MIREEEVACQFCYIWRPEPNATWFIKPFAGIHCVPDTFQRAFLVLTHLNLEIDLWGKPQSVLLHFAEVKVIDSGHKLVMKEPGFASRQLQSCLHSDVSSKLRLLQNQQHLLNEWVNELYFMVLPDWMVAYIKHTNLIEQPEFTYSCFCVWVYILHMHVWMCNAKVCMHVWVVYAVMCTWTRVHCVHALRACLCVQMHVLCLCMLICVYILCIHVYIGAWICMHTCVYVYLHMCIHLCVSNVCVYTKMWIFRFVCLYVGCVCMICNYHPGQDILHFQYPRRLWLS